VFTRNTALDNYEIEHVVVAEAIPRIFRLNTNVIPGDRDRPQLILLTIEDVTARNATADRLRDADRRKNEFLAMLAHELRNPLTPITHAIHLLQGKTAGAVAPQLYDMIQRQTRRLVRLVDELLDVARISRGHIELRREPVDLAVIAQQAADASRARIDERQHQLSIMLPNARVPVNGDPVRLEQIISNLLDNAAKYTKPGGQIRLSLKQDGDQALLSVRDNGIGIEAHNLNCIFDLFNQVDSSLARSGGGLGIGLTLVRRMLELHGGSIEARSAGLGYGTEFIVRLPTELPAQTAIRITPSAVVQAGRSYRVLIVEDNLDAAESLALLVRQWGHEVAVAHDGPSALDIMQRFQPEQALVDIGLPGMDGYELGRRLRTQHEALYLVAMTGYGREEDRDAAHDAGFDAHFVKPADPEQLRDLMAQGVREAVNDVRSSKPIERAAGSSH
jgi:two-component system CheB/CheR fusion protein